MAGRAVLPSFRSRQPAQPGRPSGGLSSKLSLVWVPAWGSNQNGLSCPDVLLNRSVSQTGTQAARTIGPYGIGTQWTGTANSTYEQITGAAKSGQPLTIFVVYRRDTTDGNQISWSGRSDSGASGLAVGVNGSGQVFLWMTGVSVFAHSSATFSVGASGTYAATYDASGNYSIWLNGKKDTTGTSVQTPVYNDALIGCTAGGAEGRETLFAVYAWSRILSDGEIQALSANPNSFFPKPRRIYFGAATGGGSTLSVSGDSSGSFTGASLWQAALSVGGTATASFVGAAQDAAVFSASADSTGSFVGTTGGATLSSSGDSSVSFTGGSQAAASLSAAGDSTASFTGAENAAGALSASGTSSASFTGVASANVMSASGDSSMQAVGASDVLSSFLSDGDSVAIFVPPIRKPSRLGGAQEAARLRLLELEHLDRIRRDDQDVQDALRLMLDFMGRV